jgi:phosphoribosylformylglycinamidine cyclo-ligase
MILALDPAQADLAVNIINKAGEKAYIIGEVGQGTEGVKLC